MYLSTVLGYLYLSIIILSYLILLLYYISEGNIVLFTPLHLFDSFSYFSVEDLFACQLHLEEEHLEGSPLLAAIPHCLPTLNIRYCCRESNRASLKENLSVY